MVGYMVFIFLTLLHFGLDQSYNKVGYVQRGTASYYAEDFHGKKTANGEKFDMNALTAAHPRIRFNTMLKVTNSENGKTVMVRINDRGPYVGGRILDLSKAAAKQLDMVKNGTTAISAEVVRVEDIPTIEDITKRKEETKKQPTTPPVEKSRTKVGGLLDKIKNALLGKKQPKKEPVQDNEPQQEKPKETKQEQPKDTKQEQPKKATTKPAKQDEIEEVLPDLKKDTKKNTAKPPVVTTPVEAEVDLPQPKPTVKPVKTPEVEKTTSVVDESKFVAMNTYNSWGTEKFPQGFGVQLGSYADFTKTMELAKAAHQTGIAPIYIQVGVINDKKVYRVLAGEGDTATVRTFIPLFQAKGYNGIFLKQHY